MIFLSSAAAFGFIGLISIVRKRHASALRNFLWCLILLLVYFLFARFSH